MAAPVSTSNQRPRTVDWTRLTEPQIAAWHMRIDQIRHAGCLPEKKHRPLEELPVIYVAALMGERPRATDLMRLSHRGVPLRVRANTRPSGYQVQPSGNGSRS